jgi:hypothetical protein
MLQEVHGEGITSTIWMEEKTLQMTKVPAVQ